MITVKNLNYTYRGTAVPAIKQLNFHIAPGEIVGFLGPSGAGKSTTQRILIGLLKGYGGEVTIMGRDLRDWGADLYEHIGVSFEVPNHFLKLTAVENLTYFRALYAGKTESPQNLLSRVGLDNDGGTLVSQYSKGMKNRLTLARALLHNPKLLFLDEPTAGLDPVNARRIKTLIQTEKAAGKTIFLTTHNMSIADDLCDYVAFIMDGAITLIDSPRRLKLAHGQKRVRVEFRTDGQLATADFPLDGLGRNAAYLTLLQSGTVQTIHTQEATLEDVFIQATGRGLA